MQEETPYRLIGGEATVARLCDRFYELMNTFPQFNPGEAFFAAQQARPGLC